MSDLQPIIDYLDSLTKEVADLKKRMTDSEGVGLPNLKFTAGSLLFAGASGFPTQDNANLSFNDTTNILSINGVPFPVAIGTFTPTFAGLDGGATWTYSLQTGFYTRIANICLFRLSLTGATRAGTALTAAIISGLPFTSDATANDHSPCDLDTIDTVTLSATCTQLTARVPNNASYIQFVETLGTAPTSTGLLAPGAWAPTSTIRVAGQYMVA